MPRVLLIGAIALALVFGRATTAVAQDAPVDVGGGWRSTEPGVAVELPPPPVDYAREQRGEVQWTFPRAARSETEALMSALPGRWNEVTRPFGGEIDRALIVRVARNPADLQALAPIGMPPPDYAAGVAYPRHGVILLTLTAPETWQRPDLETVLRHELSHVALHRAVEGHRLPRWFVEGVAIHQADEQNIGRIRALWDATLQDRVMSLRRLSDGFPSKPHEVNIAYAQSADFVAFLFEREDGRRRFRRLLTEVRSGETFNVAIEHAYGTSLWDLEAEWNGSLDERYESVPLLVGGGSVWVLAAGLLVVAWVRRRRAKRLRLAQWAEEEEAVDRLERLVDARLSGAWVYENDEDFVNLPVGERRSEAGLPTISHDGSDHTVH